MVVCQRLSQQRQHVLRGRVGQLQYLGTRLNQNLGTCQLALSLAKSASRIEL